MGQFTGFCPMVDPRAHLHRKLRFCITPYPTRVMWW
jgi:hypothetical protein